MPRVAEETRRRRRTELMDAAWRCLARKGYRDLTVDDVCVEAGVSKGSFYGYFESKKHMLTSLLEEDDASLDASMEELGRARLTSVERLRSFTRAVLDRAENAARVQLRADLWTELLTDDAVRARLAESVRVRRARLRGWIEDGVAAGELVEVPANALASILPALADGLVLHRQLDPDGFKWANVRAALDVLLSGLHAPDAQP
jgi:AcrR family transcriptional regulator